MTLDRYALWLGRGRTHQKEHRLIDALLCYRRALREAAPAADAQFHIGEIAWQMGNSADAMSAWRASIAQAPTHLPSWQALADAQAAEGDFAASLDAVERVLALAPEKPRSAALRVLLTVAHQGDFGQSLAPALRSRKLWPLLLVAAVLQRTVADTHRPDSQDAVAALVDAALASAVTPGTVDAIRRISLALALAGHAGNAERFADHYAAACRALYPAPIPLVWPLRTAGTSVRLGVLAMSAETDGAAFRAAVDASDLAGRIRCTLLVAPGGEVRAIGGSNVDAVVLPESGDSAARAVAALDFDVLVDLAGVRRAWGPLLAQHAARAIWTLETTGVPSARALVDRRYAAASETIPSEMLAALAELHRDIATTIASPLDAGELSRLWEVAIVAHRQRDVALARGNYARVLDAQPGHAPAQYLIGVACRDDGDDDSAIRHFRGAVAAAPSYVDARIALVDSLIGNGDSAEAVRLAREGLEQRADSAAVWRAVGRAELNAGDGPAAAAAFEASLQREPMHGETHYNHGVALQTARRPTDAARAYQRALAIEPGLHAADFNLGVIFDQQANAEAAITAFSNVLRQAPRHAAAYRALAEVLLAAGRVDAWFANFDQFERNCPDHLALAVHALEVCAYRADFPGLDRYLDGLRQGRFIADSGDETLDALQQLLYLLHFFDVESDLIGRYARTHEALAAKLYGQPMERRATRRPGKPRVGYLSGDFRNHVMGKMMWEAVSRHDRAAFETFGYSINDSRDEWTARFESAFSAFEALGDRTDRAAAERIADDDLDILVDLSTHTKGSRPGILAFKPARVAITHVASAGTLAMAAIDFKLTDRFADTDADRENRIEPLLAMEGCVYPYRHVAPADRARIDGAALELPADAIVIGAFCTPLKLSQRCLGLWREVMARVPRAVLAFSPLHPGLRSVFRHIASVTGIAPRRIVFVPQGRGDAENQARYRLVDFVLDPMPYGGANGTLEALDMGVPVVTLVGARHAERTSYSILSNLGVTDTIAQTGGEYVAIAERLANDPVFMGAVRARIASGLRHSELTDMDAHVRNLESAYIRALAASAPESLADAH